MSPTLSSAMANLLRAPGGRPVLAPSQQPTLPQNQNPTGTTAAPAQPGPDFAAMAKNYDPTSSMYKMLSGFAANPGAYNTPGIADEVNSALSIPAMPSVTATNPNGSTDILPYNAPPPAGDTNLQLTAPGSPGYLQSAPGGSAATVANPFATQASAPITGLSNQAPGVSAPNPSTGAADPSNPGFDLSGNPLTGNALNPFSGGSAGIGGQVYRPMGQGGIGAQGNTNIGGLPINLGGLNLGSLNTSAMLPALISSLGGLWSMMGSSSLYNQAGDLVNNAEKSAGSQVNGAAQNAASNITGTAQNAAAGVNNATGTANNTLGGLYNTSTGALSPYSTAGETGANGLTSGLQPGGALNNTLTPDEILKQNPGYQFMLGQGEQGIQNQLAAEGLGDSGSAGKAISDYQQNMAENAYQTAFQNQQIQEQNLFGRLYNTAGLGTTATGQGITAGEAFGAPQAANDISSSIYGGNATQNAADTAGGFNMAGSQYQGNAGVTGAGAQAGAKIDIAQQQQAFIQQLTTSLLSLFQNNNNNNNGSSNPLSQVLGMPLPLGTTSAGVPGYATS